jgi:cytochrome c oxidase assembly factor CtaG
MFDGLSASWPWNPGALIIIVLFVVLYLLGLRSLRTQHHTISPIRIVAFFAGIILVALLLLTPVDTIGRTQLFSVHMAQAVILITLCSPLLLAGCPAVLLQPLIELPVLRQIIRWLTQPLIASLLFNINFLLWHTPRIYEASMADPTLYQIQMLSIFLTSLLNWWPLIGSVHELRQMSYPIQMLYAFFDGQPVDIFAFVLVFSFVPIYSNYAIPAQLGLSAFSDQAVGGALLLIPGLVDLAVMTPLFFRWLGQIEKRTHLADEERQRLAEMEEADWEEDEDEDDEIVHQHAGELKSQEHS